MADIDKVETVVNKISYDNLMFPEPVSEMEARFSMEYAIALAITKGQLRIADFRSEIIADENIRKWFPKIKMLQTPLEASLPVAENGREPAKVIIHTKDGRVLDIFKQRARGVLQNPLTEDEMWAKFDDCMDSAAMAIQASEIRACLEVFETLDNVSELMKLLRSTS